MTLTYAESTPFISIRNSRVRRLLFVARVLGYLVMTSFILGLIGLAGFFFGGFFGTAYLCFILLLALLALGQARLILSRRRLAAIFNICARAIDAQLPLPEFLHAAARSEQGAVLRHRLRRIAMELSAGAAIDRALTHSLPELDDRQASLLVAAASTSALAPTLDRLAAECSPPPEDRQPTRPSTLAYAAWTLAIMGGVSSCIVVFVLPKFRVIMRDFGLPFKDILSPLLPVYATLSVIGVIFLYHLVFTAITRLFQRRSTGGTPVPFAFVRYIPILGDLLPSPARHRYLADLYHAIADALASNQPLPSVLLWAASNLSKVPRQEVTQQRQALADQISSGADLSAAARAAGIPRADVAFFSAARDAASLITAFRLLAEQRDRIATTLEYKLAAIGSLLLLFLLTAFILPLIYSLWAPLLTLLEGTMDRMAQARW